MDEKDLELTNDNLEPVSEPTEEVEVNIENPALEENDNWKFDGEATTLGSNLIENDEFEIYIPEKKESYETAPRPTKSAPAPAPEKKQEAKVKGDKALFIILAVLMAVVIAVIAVFGTFYYTKPNSDEKMNPGNVAVTVGKTPVSIGMYNYYYTCISQNYISYASYGYYDLDTSVDYDEQMTTNDDGEEVSWAQLFEDETMEQIQYITAYYEEAVKAGVKLTDAQKETISNNLNSLKESASAENVSVNEYISSTYGDYCGYATLEKMLEQCYIAENYYQQKNSSLTVTDEEVEAYFEENKADYENVKFAYLQVGIEEGENEKVLAKCNKYAQEIKSVDDMKKLIPTACKSIIDTYVAQGYAENAEACAEMLAANIEVSITASEEGFLDEAIDWLFDEKTPVGACKAFEDAENNVVYVLYKTTEPMPTEDEVYSVRQILLMPEGVDASTATSGTEYTEEQLASAKKKADDVLAEYNKGEKTEDAFAKLAEKYSEDIESTSNGSSGMYGGLYEGVAQGTMVPNFENWSMDASRKYGDVDIVDSNYGYHIMFFVKKQPKYLYDCQVALKKDLENEFVDSAKVKFHKSAMKKVKVAQPEGSADDESDSEEIEFG